MAQQGKGTRLSDFDGYYAGVYGHDRWQSLRAKLPEPSSQVGLVNRLVPEAEVEMAMPSAKTVKLTPGLEVGQPPGSSLPRAPSGLAVTYGMDLASLLPTLALDPQPGERVLDACASPGGKALAVLNRLLWSEGKAGEEGGSDPTLTSHLTVNEPSLRRLKRLKGILSDFVPLHLRHSCTQVRLASPLSASLSGSVGIACFGPHPAPSVVEQITLPGGEDGPLPEGAGEGGPD